MHRDPLDWEARIAPGGFADHRRAMEQVAALGSGGPVYDSEYGCGLASFQDLFMLYKAGVVCLILKFHAFSTSKNGCIICRSLFSEVFCFRPNL